MEPGLSSTRDESELRVHPSLPPTSAKESEDNVHKEVVVPVEDKFEDVIKDDDLPLSQDPDITMLRKTFILFILAVMIPYYSSCIAITNITRGGRVIGKPPPNNGRCTSRIESTLENMKKVQPTNNHVSLSSNSALLDLEGYALHQPLRTAPYDMYVTSMRVRVPKKTGWYRVERCNFYPQNSSLEMRLLFRDLTVTGIVKLYDETVVLQDPYRPLPADTCNMTLRLRRAALGIVAQPRQISRGSIEIATNSHFAEPDFISVYAYGCQLPKIEHRRQSTTNDAKEGRQTGDFTQEMEDVFVRGIQSLLTTYMEKQLQIPIKETLMTNMGYTISYGR